MNIQSALAVLLTLSFSVDAQYQQDYLPVSNGGVTQYFFQPTIADVPAQVVDLGPDQEVILVYNCFYMRDICKNVNNFRQTARGQNPHLRSGIDSDRFGYDFNNRRVNQLPNRKNRRRDQSCPDSWKDDHPCPEIDQRPVMRQDGQWFSNALEPGTTINQVINRRLPNQVINSGVRYTCDEFPPATWVEGGNGENYDSPAETRCAAFRCLAGYKSEQNWQGTAHNRLRQELQRVVIERRTNNGEFQFFQSLSSVVLFRFLLINTADGVAARVLTQHEDPTAGVTVSDSNIGITQAKRGADANITGVEMQPRRSLTQLNYEEIRARIDAGHGSESVIVANESAVSWSLLNGRVAPIMESTKKTFRWDQDDDNDEDHGIVAASELEPEHIVRRHAQSAPSSVSDALSTVHGSKSKPSDLVSINSAPSGPFPTPPPRVLPRQEPVAGLVDEPTIAFCSLFLFDPLCLEYPWLFSDNSTESKDDPYEYYGEDTTSCPLPSSSSSSSSTTTTTATPEPEPSPFEQGNPLQNEVDCYGSGEQTENERMQNAAEDFCLAIENDDLIEDYFRSEEYTFPYNGGIGYVSIIVSLEIEQNCEFAWNLNECKKYLSVPTDSCNCGGVNGKQGGVVSNDCLSWRIDPEINI